MDFWIGFLSAVFLVAGGAGLSRSLHNGDYKSLSQSGAVFVVSGCLGLGLIACNVGDVSGDFVAATRLVGWAVLIGLLGKDGLLAFTTAAKTIIEKFIGSGGRND